MTNPNPINYIELTAEAIEKRLPSAKNRYCLVFHKGEILCLPFPVPPHVEEVFYTWNFGFRFKGFGGGEWNRIGYKLTKFFMENPQCTLK